MDEIDRLIIQVEGEEKIRKLTEELERQQEAMRKAIEMKDKGLISDQMYASAMRSRARQTADLTSQIKKLEGQTRDLGRGVLEASHAFQDFVQGGLGGVLNNIPGIIEKFGGTAGLAGAIGAVGVAAYVAMPYVESLWKALTDGGEKIPTLADETERLSAKLKEGTKALEGIRDAWGGTAGEVAKYNAQLAANVQLEKDVNAQRERRKAIEEEAAGGKPTAGAAEAAQKAIAAGGGFDVTANEARNAINAADPEIARLRGTIGDLTKRLNEGYKNVPGYTGEYVHGQIADIQKKIDSLMSRNNTAAVDLVGRARTGETTAIGQLANLLPGGGFNAATPEGLASAREAAETVKRDAEQQQQAEKDREQRRKDNEQAAAKAKADAFVGPPTPAPGDLRAGRMQVREIEAGEKEQQRQAQQAERDAALAAARAPAEAARARDARETGQIQDIAFSEFGEQLDDTSAKQALAEAREFVRLGAQPMDAALVAIRNLLQAQAQAYQRYTQQFMQLGGQAAMMQQQFQQGPAMGGFSGMPRMW